jgi:DNA-3-methyladenine glycosylase I
MRCAWVPEGDPLYVAYHDEEWGVPSRDPVHLFEMLVLEGAQAGLSWSTILHKREGYRRAFAGFDPAKVARLDAERPHRRPGNRPQPPEGRVGDLERARVARAGRPGRAALVVRRRQAEDEPFRTVSELPAQTPESAAMSKELKRRGFRFVGPTTCYSLMQACGLVDDHTTDCFRYGVGSPGVSESRS